MRKIIVLTLLLVLFLLTSPISGVRHEIYSEASFSDEGIHSYFSHIIEDAGICLDKFIDEGPDADNFASSLESEMKVTAEESVFYAAKGIESNVSWVVKPFSSLSGGIKKIVVFQSVFLTNLEIVKSKSDYSAYVRARTAVIHMRTGADEINRSLDGIESIELWNETSKLLFDISDLREKLKDVYALIGSYEKMLEKYELEPPIFGERLLVVAVSDEYPVLHQEITIHLYARNVTPLLLFIGNSSFELKNQTTQTKKYCFEQSGEYLIYAEGATKKGELVKSNTMKVYVDKIPTSITLSSKYAAFLDKDVKVAGLLVDCHDEPLHAANVTVKVGRRKNELTTDKMGCFYFYCTGSAEGYLNVTAFYPGNDSYKSSSANLSIFFSRLPVLLRIESDKTYINANETVNFTGSVYVINQSHNVLLTIFVNSISVKTLTTEENFDFSLRFSSPETYEVYAFFPGDSLFKPAKSNVIKITVTEKAEVAGKRVEEIITKIVGIVWLIANPRSYLFSTDTELEEDLNKGIIPKKLKKELENKSVPLSEHATITKEKENEWAITDEGKFIITKGDGKLNIYREFNLFFHLLLILVAIVSFFAGLHARTLRRKLHALGEKLHILTAFSFTRFHSGTLKGKMNALISKLHIFLEKILAPIASILAGIYVRALKGKFHAFSKSRNKIHALMEKKRTGLKNTPIENPEVEVVEEEKKAEPEEIPGLNFLEMIGIEESYKLLFDSIVGKYGFKKSLTPRELLKALKKEPFAEMMEKVTELHEKAVYGNIEITDIEKEIYFKAINEILGLGVMR